MYRLIQLYTVNDCTKVNVDNDGYVTEVAAWATFRTVALPHFGVGRFDSSGGLVEITVDPYCPAEGHNGPCRGPVTVVDVERFQPMCLECGAWHDVISLRELGRRVGVPVFTSGPVTATPVRSGDGANSLSHRIARELAGNVIDPEWRERVCAELAANPRGVNGLLIGVGALSNRQVLDLYPALLSLASALPSALHSDLDMAAGKPRSPAGMAALRLGFQGLRQR